MRTSAIARVSGHVIVLGMCIIILNNSGLQKISALLRLSAVYHRYSNLQRNKYLNNIRFKGKFY